MYDVCCTGESLSSIFVHFEDLSLATLPSQIRVMHLCDDLIYGQVEHNRVSSYFFGGNSLTILNTE